MAAKNLKLKTIVTMLFALAIPPIAATGDRGSGAFGEWEENGGLPAYSYAMRHDDPRAIWDPKVFPETNLHWHQVGNDRINANAYNLGFVKLFYGESGAVWLNEYEPEKGAHSGGFGWLIDGETVFVDRDEMVTDTNYWERIFGIYFFRKFLSTKDLWFEHTIYAPQKDVPALISRIEMTNNSDRDKEYQYIEYWDVNMNLMKDFLVGMGAVQNLRDEKVKMVEKDASGVKFLMAEPKRIFGEHGGFPDKPVYIDPEIPALFLASPDAQVEAWITNPEELFDGEKIITDPTALVNAGGPLPEKRLAQKKVCLAARVKIKIPAGGRKAVRFIYGYEKGRETAEEVIQNISGYNPGELSSLTADTWREQMPSLDIPEDRFLSRELMWDYYYFTSSAIYDAYYQTTHIPQGANYLYKSGGNGATRDYAAFVQTLTYYRPDLAREILTFMMRCQETDGRLFYDLAGFGKRYTVPYRPGDLDLWFLWSLTEYVFVTRDFDFLDEEVPFYPLHEGESGTVWEHARRSLDHLVNVIGTGPHGHVKLRLSDWNDEMMWLTAGRNPIDTIATFKRGESVMNTAMAVHILPMFADLAGIKGDLETAREAKLFEADMKEALEMAWHEDHLIRAYSGLGKPFGKDEMYLEPQAWALLEPGALSPDKEKILVKTIDEKLRKPSALGMMISTSTSGSMTTRPGEQEEGGIWFAINGPAAVALSRFDREMAWQEVINNTLYKHAETYPETWYGIWSGPDAWNSVFSDRPAETWYMKTPGFNTGPQMYPIQNAHSHCQTMWAVARLAGLTPYSRGWRITPRIPYDSYSFSCRVYSIKVEPGRVSGAINVEVGDEDLELRVEIPGDLKQNVVSASINGIPREWEAAGGEVVIRPLPLTAKGEPLIWSVEYGR